MDKNQAKHCVAALAVALCTVSLAGLIAGCAPQKAPEGRGAASQPTAVEFTWSASADCATCHISETDSMGDLACSSGLEEKGGDVCVSCHTDEAGLLEAHEGATPEGAEKTKVLKSSVIDEEVCFSCHGSYDELAGTTAASTVLTDSNGTTVNPHERPATEDHAEITCASCHAMHTGDPVAEVAPDYCAGCHHAGEYKCYTCHE